MCATVQKILVLHCGYIWTLTTCDGPRNTCCNVCANHWKEVLRFTPIDQYSAVVYVRVTLVSSQAVRLCGYVSVICNPFEVK